MRGQERVPLERLYWAVLDTRGMPAGLPLVGRPDRRRRLGYLFEAVLPVPIDDVHAVYAALGEDRVLACGMDRDALRGHIERGVLSLIPDAIPDGLGLGVESEGVAPASLNLLVGDMTPPAKRRALRRWRAQTALLLLLVTAAACFGLHRRAQWHGDRQAAIEAQMNQVYAAALPPGGPSAQPAALRLLAEQRRLEQTRVDDRQPVRDVTAELAGILGAWPTLSRVRTEMLGVSEDGVSIRVVLPGHDDATRLYEALRGVHGVTVDQPRIDRQRDGVRVTLRVSRSGESAS